MHKRLTLLVILLVVIASVVVELRYRNRVAFAQLQQLQAERDALDTEWGQLLLEQAAWAGQRRVEAVASTRLGMVLPAPNQVVIVYRNGSPP